MYSLSKAYLPLFKLNRDSSPIAKMRTILKLTELAVSFVRDKGRVLAEDEQLLGRG
jgi:hypothetical protein